MGLIVLSYDQDLLAYAASYLIAHSDPPDLGEWTVLLPDLHHAGRWRRQLLQAARSAGFSALLGPTVTTLDGWLDMFVDPGQRRQISHQGIRLMLVESLRHHPQLYGTGGPWALADSLIVLFDELTRQCVRLPDSLEAFTRQLHLAYRSDPAQPDIPLTREANLVYTLWHAWQEQQQVEGLIDPESARVQRLLSSSEQLPAERQLLLLGYDHLGAAESDWLRRLTARGQARLIMYGTDTGDEATAANDDLPHFSNACQRLYRQLAPPPASAINYNVVDSAFGAFIDAVFAPRVPNAPDGSQEPADLATRGRAFADRYPHSPLRGRVTLINTTNPEQQARSVDVRIRRWLIDGKQDIALICADSRLSRRVRALLERGGVHLRDQNGWTLSTSRAAAILERLLQTAEEDYDQAPLLDLLKSPFILPAWDEDERLNAAWQLERDIIQHENVARGLQRYHQHIRWRQHRLGWSEDHDHPVRRLLDDIERAVEPLHSCATAGGSRPAGDYLQALGQAFRHLGLETTLAADPAGERLLEELQVLQEALELECVPLTWLEFRNWLGQALEQAYFLPPADGDNAPQVQLLTLSDTPLGNYDALIFASADQEHLPAAPAATPFFNDAVRIELGLESGRQHHELALARFRSLLQRAPEIVFSWHRQDGDKPVNASPWVTLLDSFHQFGYGESLEDPLQSELGRTPETQVLLGDDVRVPEPLEQPAADGSALLPDAISASRYQRLVDCPYLFFAADCLGLKAAEHIRLTLEKSDYGQRVHRILQAFHSDIAGLPGPFTAPLADTNREQARHCLEDISRAVFAEDLEDNALHRGWLHQWLDLIPAYLDWQQQRQHEWLPLRLEITSEVVMKGPPSLTLTGRIDRVDGHVAGMTDGDGMARAIIDYKTGRPPKEDDIISGEAVQLPFYALLQPEHLQQIEYLQLGRLQDRPQARTALCLDGETLHWLREQHQHRLLLMFAALEKHQPLPAWGDEHTCDWCDMSGLCRRQIWEDAFTAGHGLTGLPTVEG
jgi:ATP-dependent helicase/nuclease subunit B